MSSKLFRETSLKRISSPERLNEYIRVSTPAVWLLLAAIILLLTGAFVWGAVGRLDTVVDGYADVRDGEVTLYITKQGAESIDKSATFMIDGREYAIMSLDKSITVSTTLIRINALSKAGLAPNVMVYTAKAQAPLENGVYAAKVIINSVTPLSFIFN